MKKKAFSKKQTIHCKQMLSIKNIKNVNMTSTDNDWGLYKYKQSHKGNNIKYICMYI